MARKVGAGLHRTWRFVAVDVWDIELASMSRRGRFLARIVRVVSLVFKGFRDDECPLHASALTFSTLMSIVPVLAVSLALARGFGAAEAAKSRVMDAVNEWTQTFELRAGTRETAGVPGDDMVPLGETVNVVDFDSSTLGVQIQDLVQQAFDKVENISFTALGGVALILLIWMVISVLGRVEGSFNRVWGVTVGRSMWRKFTDYLSILIILPILIAAASSLPVVDYATRFLGDSSVAVVRGILDSAPLKTVTVVVMTTLCFGFIIMFMPNTRVKASAGLTGGFVTGLLFIGWMGVCAAIQVGAAKYGKIYGSFAVVPILLAWVYVSWQIILFGAEVAFAVQNYATYRMEQGSEKANFRARFTLALCLIVAAARNMLGMGERLDITAYAREQRIPVRLLNDVVSDLVRLAILAEVSEGSGYYVLLKAPESLEVQQVLAALSNSGVTMEKVGLADIDPVVTRVVDQADRGLGDLLHGVTIKDLAQGGKG